LQFPTSCITTAPQLIISLQTLIALPALRSLNVFHSISR
jgi:hypothetical protein